MAIKNYLHEIKRYKSFGISIFMSQALVDLIKHLIYTNRIDENNRFNTLFSFAIKRKDRKVQKYLEKKYIHLVKKFDNQVAVEDVSTDKNIWVMWLQGLDEAPDLVKKTYRSIIRNKGDYSIIFLDGNNYCDYISVPQYIQIKHETGKISNAHYSDYIRIAILAKYGGIWLDSTVYLYEPMPNDYLDYSQFHAKGIDRFPFDYLYLDSHKWESYFLCGRKGNKFYSYLKECLEVYWKENDFVIDYLFLNHFSKIGREKILSFKKEWEAIPNNNYAIETLYRSLQEKWCPAKFESKYRDTKLFKLNHRHILEKYDSQGYLTNYGYLTKILEDNDEQYL